MKIVYYLLPALICLEGMAATRPTFSEVPGLTITNATITNAPSANTQSTNVPETITHEPAGGNLQTAVDAAAAYEPGQSLEAFRWLEEALRESTSRPELRKQIETVLIALLSTNATFEARTFAAKQLGIIGSQKALPALSQLLKEGDTTWIACLALTTYPPGKADEALRLGLRFASAESRVQILNTLGDRKDVKAVGLLSHHAGDPDTAVAEAAIAALGKIGDSAAYKAIRSVDIHSRPELSGVVTDALLRYAENRRKAGDLKPALAVYNDLLHHSDLVAARRKALAVLLQYDLDGGEARIIEVLSGTDEALKPVAIRRITSVPSVGASEKFAREMRYLSVDNQALLLDSLVSRGDDAARLELAKSLSSPEPALRRAGIAALGRIGDPYFVSLLARAANSGDPEETKAIENTLVDLKGGAATDKRMLAELKNALPKARVPLISAVARRQGAAANPVLLEEVNNSDPSVAKAALRALAKTGGTAEATVLAGKLASFHDAGVRTEAQSTVSQLLSRIVDPGKRFAAVKDSLERATNVESRLPLFDLLPACGNEAALSVITTATRDPEPQIRESALRALAEWPNDAAWDVLMAVYRRRESETSSGVALRGMVRLLSEAAANPDSTVISRYRELFASAHSETDIKLLLGSISNVPDPDALSVVIPLLSYPGASREAAAAANNIVETIRAKHPELVEEAQKRLQQKVPSVDPSQNLN